MSQEINQNGIFRGQILEFGLYEPESGAVGVSVKARIDEQWNTETKAWDDWREYDVTADGTVWVIKKDGSLNDKQVESLIKATGWDGNIEAVRNGEWQPTPCQLVVNEDTYKDEVRYKISFVNEYDRTPGAVGNVSPDRAKQLQTQYGAQLRALAGNVLRNAAPPAGKPKAPKPAAKPATKTAGPMTQDARKALAGAASSAVDPNDALAEAGSGEDVPF
jgi:hypothetical protein